VREEERALAKAPKPPKAAKPRREKPPRPDRDATRLEAEIETAEAALAALEQELADPAAWNDPRTAARSTARHEEARRALQELYERWEAVAS
jgi:ATP-binding cassette subfamily F protein 3